MGGFDCAPRPRARHRPLVPVLLGGTGCCILPSEHGLRGLLVNMCVACGSLGLLLHVCLRFASSVLTVCL